MRQEGYVVDEQGHKLTLKDFGLEVKFAGRLTWFGKGGRLEVYRDEAKNAWHASIPEEWAYGRRRRETSRSTSSAVKGGRSLSSP